MTYSISALAHLAGVSARTLRYYDQLGLLKPTTTSSAGYRYYDQVAVDRLQQICFFKQFGLSLKAIQTIMKEPPAKRKQRLHDQRQTLVAQRDQLTALIETLDVTLQTTAGGQFMTNEEKFAAFKQSQINQNNDQFGDEVQQRWGQAALETGNQAFNNLSQADYTAMQATETKLISALVEVIDNHEETDERAQMVVELHKQWLSYTWPTYSTEAHRGLGQLYVTDDRFAHYYRDRTHRDQAAATLNRLIQHYAH